MLIMGMIIIAFVIIGVMAMMSDEEPRNPKKPWKPKKKNFFVRWGETGGKYYW